VRNYKFLGIDKFCSVEGLDKYLLLFQRQFADHFLQYWWQHNNRYLSKLFLCFFSFAQKLCPSKQAFSISQITNNQTTLSFIKCILPILCACSTSKFAFSRLRLKKRHTVTSHLPLKYIFFFSLKVKKKMTSVFINSWFEERWEIN